VRICLGAVRQQLLLGAPQSPPQTALPRTIRLAYSRVTRTYGNAGLSKYCISQVIAGRAVVPLTIPLFVSHVLPEIHPQTVIPRTVVEVQKTGSCAC